MFAKHPLKPARTLLAAGLFGTCLGGAAAAAAGPTTVTGRIFATLAPAGWSVHKSTGYKGAHTYALTSGGRADLVSIPRPGEIAVSIYEVRTAQIGLKPGTTAARAVPKLVGVPALASQVRRTGSGETTLGGGAAVAISFTYLYKGRHIRQSDTVAVHKGYAVAVETDADASSGAAAVRARRYVQGHWRWR